MLTALLISLHDFKYSVIPDKWMFPALIVLGALLGYEGKLVWDTALAVALVLGVFLIPILSGMAFGGGDLRFGAFSALLVGLEGVGYFILYSGLVHLAIAAIARQKKFPFAPAMSIGALAAYGTIHA